MEKPLPPAEFLAEMPQRAVLDVRSPGEFAQGHIPGALSFPLFSDAERAEVGTIYKQKSREAALERGLEIVGPKMADFVREAAQIAPDRRVAVHCWRGGQRSRSMAWLLGTAGFDATLLAGGYKNYRQHVLAGFEKTDFQLIVLGGRTGTGKTKILHELAALGEQIIDLEALAHHKGSAFGWLGEVPQPTVEQFENDLFAAISRLDARRRVWVENESRSIGRVFVPEGFWAKMKAAPLVNVEIPFDARLQNLLDDYAHFPIETLEMSFQKIASKLGGQNLNHALESMQAADFKSAAEIALRYYDKTYQHGLDSSRASAIHLLQFEHADFSRIAADCAQLVGNEFLMLDGK